MNNVRPPASTQTSGNTGNLISNGNVQESGSSIPLSPDDLLNQLLIATNLEQTGQIEEAVKLYQEIIALDPEGVYGMSARKALKEIQKNKGQQAVSLADGTVALLPEEEFQAGKTTRDKSETLIQAPQGPFSWIQRTWENLSFANKLMILLVSGAVFPVVIATQGLVAVTQNSVQQEFREDLQADADAWEEEYILWVRDESRSESENLARLVEAQQIDLNSPRDVSLQQRYLQSLVLYATSANDEVNPEMTKSFRLLTDSQGRTVAQNVKIQIEAAGNNALSPLPAPGRPITSQDYRNIVTQPKINLGDLPIVKNAVQTGKPLRGVELVPGQLISQLGLESQATIPARLGTRQSVSASSEPVPEGTYNLDGYRSGLVSMAVYPIRINNQVVGTAIVGSLLNRNNTIVDYFYNLSKVPALSIYAYNWRVNTIIPAEDGKNRALGVLAPQAVSAPVLEQGQSVFWEETIAGTKYLAFYRPIYNHQQELNPDQAKPVGMLAVARPKTDLERLLWTQQLVGLAIAGGVVLVIVLLAIPIAKAFAGSLQNLARFAQRVGSGETGARLKRTDRKDEIGVLARELNEMAASVDANIAAARQQEQLRYQEAEQQRQERERLQRSVMNLLLEIEGAQHGDLTVNVPVTEGAVGSIADAFNNTIRSLRQLVFQMQSVSNQVHDLAEHSTPTVQQLSQFAATQANEIQQALETVSQISDSIRQVSESAQEAAKIAQKGVQTAHAGEQVMDMTVRSMDNIQTAVAQTAEKVDRLTESFGKISQILTVISGISERTNLLAYNASIEASRAGENGQGFRVVAEEVRRLAQRVTDATKNIEAIVSAIQQEVVEVRQAMEMGTSEVQAGTELAGKTRETLQGLANISQAIDQYLKSISRTTTTQAAASQQVNQTMEQVATITQTTSQEAQELAQSLEEFTTVAKSLQASVSQFRLQK